ncbi:MAG: hypothetical protein ACI4TM_05110 [Candidatus Cryptobacteroides sp.]
MKKSIILTIVLALAFTLSAAAQPRSIGVNVGYGLDISYQHTLGPQNMLDLSVSFPGFVGVGAQATYDWLNPFNTSIPWSHKGEWNWEMGVGAAAGFIFYPGWYAGAAGHVGVSYDFWFPLQLSADWRPVLGACGFKDLGAGFYGSGLYGGITIGVRYLF